MQRSWDRQRDPRGAYRPFGWFSRDYGEFYIQTVFYPAIVKLVNPLEKKVAESEAV